MIYTVQLKSLAETQALGALLAELAQPRDVITLRGKLGSGKTEFARAFIRSLAGLDVIVPSPTFTLVQTYETPHGDVWHFDLYRLTNLEEAWELGIEDAFRYGISLIEWPERLQDLPLHHHLDVLIEGKAGAEKRTATLTADSKWTKRFKDMKDE